MVTVSLVINKLAEQVAAQTVVEQETIVKEIHAGIVKAVQAFNFEAEIKAIVDTQIRDTLTKTIYWSMQNTISKNEGIQDSIAKHVAKVLGAALQPPSRTVKKKNKN